MTEKEPEYVTQADLTELAHAFHERLGEMQKQVGELSRKFEEVPTEELGEAKRLYRCEAEGCGFVTDDLGAFVGHAVDEKLRRLTPPEEGEEWGHKPRVHRTTKDFLDCPECSPMFEKILLEKGWKKPEPERDRALML